MKLVWKLRKHIETRVACVVSFLAFSRQIYLILFSFHRQQVLPKGKFTEGEMIEEIRICQLEIVYFCIVINSL